MSEQSSAVNEILENAAKNADAAETTKKVRKP